MKSIPYIMPGRSGALLGLALSSLAAHATPQLITNGGFETGDFTGWTVVNQAGGEGDFFVTNVNATSESGQLTVGPASGTFYAVSDQLIAGAHVLLQPFTVPGPDRLVRLSFDMFVNDWDAGPSVDPAGLTFNPSGSVNCPFDPLDCTPNQHARVDILTASAGPFDTGAGVLGNFYLGVDPQSGNPNPYTRYVFDISSLVAAGGTFQLRFAEVDNQSFLNLGVDNVSVAVPESASLALLGIGLAGLGFLRRDRKNT